MIDNELKNLLLKSLPIFLDELFILNEQFIAVAFGMADVGYLPATSAISLESLKRDSVATGLDIDYLKYSFDNSSYSYFGTELLFDDVADYMNKIDVDELDDTEYDELMEVRFNTLVDAVFELKNSYNLKTRYQDLLFIIRDIPDQESNNIINRKLNGNNLKKYNDYEEHMFKYNCYCKT